MFASPRNAASAYHKLGLETSVAQADPHGLIGLLYDGALTAIAQARAALRDGQVAAKGSATGRAVRIVDEGLKASLDPRGGELAANLQALYEYMSARLLSAQLHGDDSRYAEVAAMLGQLRDAWQQIGGEIRAAGAGRDRHPGPAGLAGDSIGARDLLHAGVGEREPAFAA